MMKIGWNTMTADRARSLASDAEKVQRASADVAAVAPLAAYVERLRRHGLGDVPDFDPLDGGTSAQALFLFEKPGPKAAISGFISRNNDDRTAENTFRFMQQASIPRKITCTWNVVPAWNGTSKVTGDELRSGVACLNELFELMPNLKVVMLVGRKAERAMDLLKERGLAILASCHPSPKNYALAREKWLGIPSEWAQVHRYIA
jgi:hypothetical protein